MTPCVIDAALVRRLIAAQFPHWAELFLSPLEPGGWDNRSFRLGEDMVVRLPSAAEYATQAEKEWIWLPQLAPCLPLAIPTPLAIGQAGSEYPWRWSIYRWVEGLDAATAVMDDLSDCAARLAGFLAALHRVDSIGGPLPGAHNFYRGGYLGTYDAQTREAIRVLKQDIDAQAATRIWEAALETTWNRPPVWVHGDLSAANLLVQNGRLRAVIDFGMLAVGDPACDLAIAWTLLDEESRGIFRATLPLDPDTWARGRAWALWKALVVASGLVQTNAREAAQPWRVIDELLARVEH